MVVSLTPTLSRREREMWNALRATFIVTYKGHPASSCFSSVRAQPTSYAQVFRIPDDAGRGGSRVTKGLSAHIIIKSGLSGRVVMQRPAKPWTPVRFRPQPPFPLHIASRSHRPALFRFPKRLRGRPGWAPKAVLPTALLHCGGFLEGPPQFVASLGVETRDYLMTPQAMRGPPPPSGCGSSE
jgi:hypothetical protein